MSDFNMALRSHSPADRDERLAGGALEGDGEGVREPRAVLCLRLCQQVEEPGLARRRGEVAASAAYDNLKGKERFRESALSRSAARVRCAQRRKFSAHFLH